MLKAFVTCQSNWERNIPTKWKLSSVVPIPKKADSSSDPNG